MENEDLCNLSDDKILMLAASALEDVTDGMSVHDLESATGWSRARCERILCVAREANRRFALPSLAP